MQFVDFHQLHKSLRDNIGSGYSAWVMDIVRLTEQQQTAYIQERETMKGAYEGIIRALLDGAMTVEEARKRVVMSADGVEVLDPEPAE